MRRFLALLTFHGVLVSVNGNVLEKYAERSGNLYHGRYTRDVHKPELLIPRRVFEDGSFNTYSLPNFYDRQEIVERKKRSAEIGESKIESDDRLYLVLPFNGIDHHVELNPYHDFISPDMVVETRGSGIASNLNEAVRFKRASDQQCHYRGTVRDHGDSRAALSLCDGVVGYVQTNHGRYFIEPAHEAEPEVDGQHVHIAYKRDTPGENDDNTTQKRRCGTNDNWESAWAEQLAKRQKRLMENNSLGTKRATPVSSGTHSIHRYIEIGLVADRRFLDFHNNTNYEQYLLTIMNMVSDFYHDSSSGNQIDVVVVRMIYLEKEKEEIDLHISPAAETTLDSFAKWAQKMNPTDHTHPNHYDIGVLVTRHDICSEGTNCDLMGLAFVGAACDPKKAACINEDSGLLLGIVIAHEVGHVMGCSHDEPETSGCPSQDKDKSFFIMSPIVFIFTIRWSTCSRKFMTSFLESGLGDCLNDDPRNPPDKFKYPNMLPGAMYDANFQCNMQFPNSQLCPKSSINDCQSLWCLTNSSCYSVGTPKADGTKCGENKWCIHKKCVDMGTRPAAVNGGWGSWGSMSACTRTCGGGVKYSERECDKPVPANGGRYCIGERKKIATCNTTPCDPTKPPYRALQCAEHDSRQVLSDGLHQWKPYSRSDLDPCALYCINEKHTFVKLSPTANDSTPCKPGTNYMCISGSCRKVGCDWIIDSDVIEDKCGICKGDGTKCTLVERVYNETFRKQGYQTVVTIPRGARSIDISEKKSSENMLAVKLESNKTYCLNANNNEQPSGDYECASALIIYTHPEPDQEEINIKGPIAEDITIEHNGKINLMSQCNDSWHFSTSNSKSVIAPLSTQTVKNIENLSNYAFYRPKENPGVHYKYYVMSTDPSYTPNYIWDFIEWTDCTAKCGGGTMISEASCIEQQGGKVTPNFCSGTPRPEPKSRACNTDACPAKWRVSQWSKCSACDGKKGMRHRKVQCVRRGARAGEDDVQANLDACKGRVPKQKEECVGTRPCKKSCPKKARDTSAETASETEKEKKKMSLVDQRRMIDRLVDLGLAHYLEKSRGLSSDEDRFARSKDSQDFRQLLHDWAMANEEKRKRTCEPEMNFTTPRPGSIVKDSVPIEKVVLMQAPYLEENLQSNLSDKAYQEAGDLVGMSIDTSKEKVFTGAQAVKMIEDLMHRNASVRKRNVDLKENSPRDDSRSHLVGPR